MPDQTVTPREVGTEMRQGRPWWKICCGGCCLILILLVVGAGIAWRGLGGGRGSVFVDRLPSNFPPNVTLYRLDDAKSIEYFSGHDKNRTFAALMSPLRFFGTIMVSSGETDAGQATGTARNIERFMDAGASRLQQIDTVTVRWERLAVPKADLIRFYTEQFDRNGFVTTLKRDAATVSESIIAKRPDVIVQLLVQDLPDIDGIDTVTLKVDYLNQ